MDARPAERKTRRSLDLRPGWITILLLFLLVFLLGQTGAAVAQEKVELQEEPVEFFVTFNQLGFSTRNGKQEVVPSRTLLKIQLIETKGEEDLWLELFFQNGDYVLTRIEGLTFYQEGATNQKSKVLVTRIPKTLMAFPKLVDR